MRTPLGARSSALLAASSSGFSDRFFHGQSISSVRGRPMHAAGRVYFPVFHPAVGLHSTARMRALEEDFASLGKLMGE